MIETPQTEKPKVPGPPPDYPPPLSVINQTAPVPRRIRGVFNRRVVFDTMSALYLWEWERYPQYYIPIGDVDAEVLVDEEHEQRLSRGSARRYGLKVASVSRPGALRVYGEDALYGVAGHARFEWDALDWFEEDEQIFVHPRDPYTRVDALRSSRRVRVELDGVVLAETVSPVLVFETGLPTRYYINRTEVEFSQLISSDTVTGCPYKGMTTEYWTAEIGGKRYADIAWTYGFPTRQLLPIAGLVAFYNEKVDHIVDGTRLERPITHFSQGYRSPPP